MVKVKERGEEDTTTVVGKLSCRKISMDSVLGKNLGLEAIEILKLVHYTKL